MPLRQALTGTHILENPQILIASPEEATNYARTPFAPVPLVLPTDETSSDPNQQSESTDPQQTSSATADSESSTVTSSSSSSSQAPSQAAR